MSTHNMITVKGIEQIILILVDADPELKSARQYGEFRANNSRADEYPVLFYEFAQGDMTQTQPGKWNREITMALGVAIQLLEGRTNEIDMKSRAVSILEKTVLKLRASSEFAAVGVRFPDKNITISNLEETGDDLITGVFTNIKFVLPVIVCEDDLPYLPIGTQANTYTPTSESSLFCSIINDCPTIEEMQADIALLFTLTGGTGGASTYVQPGLNIYTGGTESNPVVGLQGSISLTSVTSNSFISGSTDLQEMFSVTGHTHLSQDITDRSLGGNGAADSGLVPKFNLEGQLKASVTNSTTGAIWGNSTGTGYAGFFDAGSVNAALKVNNGGSGTGVETESSNGYGADIVSLNSAALRVHAIDLGNTDSDIAHFYESLVPTLRLTILNDGGLRWNGTGSATTRSNLGLSSVFPAPGVNTYTASTAGNTIVGVIGSPSFTAVTANNFISGSTNLNQIFAPIGSVGGGTTYVQPGTNITTGGTPSAPIVSVVASPSFSNLTATTLQETTFIAPGGIYYRGPDGNLTASADFTFDENAVLLNINGTISGATIFEGGQSLAAKYAPISVVPTYVQNGTNTTTGGTITRPTINVSATPSFTTVQATTISATTFVEGGVSLASKYAPISVVPTYVQPGLNTSTGGTISRPIINTLGTVVFTSVTTNALISRVSNDFLNSNNTVDGATFTSNISSPTTFSNGVFQFDRSILFVNSKSSFSCDTSDGTTVFVINRLGEFGSGIRVTGAAEVSSNFSAATYYSGNTLLTTSLTNLFNSAYAPISVVPTYVQPGLNTTTGGTITRPIVNLSGSISLTAVTASGQIQGATLVGTTSITEAGTLLSAKYAPRDLTITRTSGTYILTLTDDSRVVYMSAGTAQNLVIPRNSAVALPIGSQVAVVQTGAGQVSFSADTGVSILSYSSYVKLAGQYAGASLVKSDTNEWSLVGNLVA